MIKLIAIALIILGVCSVAWGGFTYKSKEKIVDIGPIEASREKTHYVPIAPVAGGLALVVGMFLHISTTIIFETNENHRFNLAKLTAILLGVGLSVGLI